MRDLLWLGVVGVAVWLLVPGVTAQTGVLSAGQYVCEGTDVDGSPYKAQLDITVQDQAALLIWHTDPQALGIGILHRDTLSVAFRDRAGTLTGIVVYDVRGQTLDGRWTAFGMAPGQVATERCTLGDIKAVQG